MIQWIWDIGSVCGIVALIAVIVHEHKITWRRRL